MALASPSPDQVLVGQADGVVSLVDTRLMEVVARVQTHSHGVSTIASIDDIFVTSGLTLRNNSTVADNTVRMYDVRAMKMVLPIQVPLGCTQVAIGKESLESSQGRTIYSLCPLRSQVLVTNIDRTPMMRSSIHVSFASRETSLHCLSGCRREPSALSKHRAFIAFACWLKNLSCSYHKTST